MYTYKSVKLTLRLYSRDLASVAVSLPKLLSQRP